MEPKLAVIAGWPPTFRERQSNDKSISREAGGWRGCAARERVIIAGVKLEDLQTPAAVRGIVADSLVTVVSASWIGANAVELVYRTAEGEFGSQIL